MKKKSLKAFSLVELLIALSIFAVVSIAIYSTFNSGFKVLHKVKDIDLAQQSFIFKVERLAKELRQATHLRKLLLTGAKTSVSFGGIVDDQPSRVTYYFDKSSQNFIRQADHLADIITDEKKIDPELKSKGAVFLKKVNEIKFAYLYRDLKKNIYAWAEEWKEDFLPLAIQVTISTDKQNYVTTIFLPTA
ncbi:MAG: prepilin-type N-terminal cleavage/methylation domain-containing protein [Candidatus Omnitrophota bacterium]|nr:prepilin-type N-terminal cleavage/methylation domain-containing protein [Candidatus Omnitrophota bacterium]